MPDPIEDCNDEEERKDEEIADADKKIEDDSLLDVVDRVRKDMLAQKERLDKLTTGIYTTSQRIRRLEG
jgi:hypothetical protein